jgi:hypothetical protein
MCKVEIEKLKDEELKVNIPNLAHFLILNEDSVSLRMYL